MSRFRGPQKPHIYLTNPERPRWKPAKWCCCTSGTAGWGATPEEAYANWLSA